MSYGHNLGKMNFTSDRTLEGKRPYHKDPTDSFRRTLLNAKPYARHILFVVVVVVVLLSRNTSLIMRPTQGRSSS